MAAPILTTKIFVPPPRPQLVPRHRLIERLNAGFPRKLTLVSAPAGFGKTTLISSWIAQGERPFAWLSLDKGDSDPTRFLTYFIAALQTIAPAVGQTALAALQSPQPPATPTILTPLLNDMATLPEGITLVLDDYHEVDARPVDELLGFLLDQLPPQLHLIITTREDPNLPLARLRVRGQLVELRATDLRFTVEETAVFLNQIMGFNLSAADITALEIRTEGWIAGLQLASLSLADRPDPSSFIRTFSGTDRDIADFLVHDVLDRLAPDIIAFLLKTSILGRICAKLADAVTGRADSAQRLAEIEQANLFLISLDRDRIWYRYHHL
ncbi:MAG: hypothetical protein KC434_09755, partial [Anaerolineales bacterium]|nr:hypothetical protein [Anaerolineales bacterium]